MSEKYKRIYIRDDKFGTYSAMVTEIHKYIDRNNPFDMDQNTLSKLGQSAIGKLAIEHFYKTLIQLPGNEQ